MWDFWFFSVQVEYRKAYWYCEGRLNFKCKRGAITMRGVGGVALPLWVGGGGGGGGAFIFEWGLMSVPHGNYPEDKSGYQKKSRFLEMHPVEGWPGLCTFVVVLSYCETSKLRDLIGNRKICFATRSERQLSVRTWSGWDYTIGKLPEWCTKIYISRMKITIYYTSAWHEY